MAPKTPPAATTILATPIENVEESRAQRLQRQQSRFRDRGGRNTLADILLGKASSIKKSRRSASLSPSKGRGKSSAQKPKSLVRQTSVREQNLRRSPRKRGRSSSVASGVAGPVEAVSKVSSHGASKALARKNSPKASAVARETPTNPSDDGDPALVKELSGKKTPALRRVKKPNSSEAKAPKPTQKAAKATENHEENETRPKITRANASISPADLMNANKSEKVASSSKAPSAKTRKKNSVATKSQSSSLNRKASSRSAVPSKSSKSRPGAPQLPDIMEEDEDDALPSTRLSTPSQESTKIRHEPTTTRKRQVIDEDPLTDPDDRPRKRTKPVRKDAAAKQPKAKATPKPQIPSDEEPSPSQRKRRRAGEQEEDVDADWNVGKPAKRKKVVSEIEKVDKPPLKAKKNVVKPRSKPAPKTQKPTTKNATTKTAKRKENSVAPQSTQSETVPVPRRGLPKSILLRLQNSSAPHVFDDEPDPIDFLS